MACQVHVLLVLGRRHKSKRGGLNFIAVSTRVVIVFRRAQVNRLYDKLLVNRLGARGGGGGGGLQPPSPHSAYALESSYRKITVIVGWFVIQFSGLCRYLLTLPRTKQR